MSNEPPMNDPQIIWQSQDTEGMKMSIAQLQERARQHRTRARWAVVTNDLAYIALLAVIGYQFTKVPNTTSRAGLGMLAAGLLYVAYRKHKQLWPLSLAEDAAPATGLETYGANCSARAITGLTYGEFSRRCFPAASFSRCRLSFRS